MDSKLSQDDIDRLFLKSDTSPVRKHGAPPAPAYDFRRPDRIPKEQLRSIHLMHDFLARNLATSLGAYLRAYVTVTLVSVEQLSFGEFLQYLPTPTCLSIIGMRPMDGNGVLEMNPSVVFPVLDILLGGTGRGAEGEPRELTEIERSIFEGVVRVVLHDLKDAWNNVAKIDFTVEGTETQPQMMQILSPNEAIVAIGFEVTMGEARGMMNLGIPSIQLKMMGAKFDQQWSMRQRHGDAGGKTVMAALLRRMPVAVDIRLEGATLKVRELLRLAPDDVVSLDIPLGRPAEMQLNGCRKFWGQIVAAGGVRGFRVEEKVQEQW